MANYIYDRDTDTLYVSDGDGFGGVALLFLLALPFLMIAAWLRQYALFASEHPLLFWVVFLVLSLGLGHILYRKKKAANKKLGIAAVIVSLLPTAMAQMFYAVPYVLSHDEDIGVAFEWLIVTFFTVGFSFFVIQVGFLFKNGGKHLMLAAVYFFIALIIIL